MDIPIDPTREYKPTEIVQNRWILNNNNNPDYKYVLKLIKAGRLRARNACLAGQKYFKVLGQSIIDYKNSIHSAHETQTDQESDQKESNLSA